MTPVGVVVTTRGRERVKSLFFCYISEYIVNIVYMNYNLAKTFNMENHRVKTTSDPDPGPDQDPSSSEM